MLTIIALVVGVLGLLAGGFALVGGVAAAAVTPSRGAARRRPLA